MTIKERIVKRLNKGFGFSIPSDANWHTHEKTFRNCGGMSWYFCDLRIAPQENVGCAVPATEALKWDRWLISKEDREIFEYQPNSWYDNDYHLLEEGGGK